MAALAVLLIAGCGALREPEVVRLPVPGSPVWERQHVREHLEFLNSPPVITRVSGSTALTTAADYLTSRMREYKLQPVYHSGFGMPFNSREHRIHSASMAVVSGDSTALSLAYDFFPDGRSDAGNDVFSFMHMAVDGVAALFPSAGSNAEALMLSSEAATTERLENLSREGFRLALLVGEPAPVSAADPVDGMMIVQVTRPAAAWILGVTPPMLDAIWSQPGVVLRSLPRRLRVEVEASTYPASSTLNLAGFLSGRHPSTQEELVIVAADMDTYPLIAGERVVDLTDLGAGLASMLEVARLEQQISQLRPHPSRSLMFTALNRRDGQGLENLLNHSPWSVDHIRRVIYIGLREVDEPAVRRILSEHGIGLDAVRPTDHGEISNRYSFTSARAAHSRSPIAGERPETLDRSQYLSDAEDVVLEMASTVHDLLLRYAGTVTLPPSETVVRVSP